ncbi:hypothetical protein [Komagataeibacter oboediens]|uniref:hypothetical protein n=1 Tax=Komagataeibacter oboediens TaxID=65958 RepID=UPI0021ABBB12|nr:hypothetical protein [Komagataeibacter oboediens]
MTAKPVEMPPDGGVIDTETHEQIQILRGKRSQRELATAKAELNFWRLSTFGLIGALIISGLEPDPKVFQA